MENVSFENLANDQQAFVIRHENEKLAEMIVRIAGDTVIVYHTEVNASQEGKGLAKLLLQAMVEHARQHRLSVNPLCVFVLAQFKRHPELYTDIWKK